MISLRSDQIDEICQLIPYNKTIPKLVANNIRNGIIQPLREQLKTIKLYPDLFDSLKEKIIHAYYTTLVAPGEAVGIQMAQSIGERATQQTLNSFHSSGLSIKTVTQGVPRFSELLSATRSPKMINCIIHLNRDYKTLEEVMDQVGTSITEVRIKRLISKSSYTFTSGSTSGSVIENWHHLFWRTFYSTELPLEHFGWRVRLEFNRELLFEYKVSTQEIANRITKEYADVFVCYTPEYVGIVDIFINKRILPPPSETSVSEASVSESIVVDDWDLSEELAEQYNYFDNKVIPALYDLLIFGVEGIKEIFYEQRNRLDGTSEWVITTEGSNLHGLFQMSQLVDATKTLCNNMWEINETLGIEATRQFLIEEFTSVVSSDGTFVNPAHIQLLVDAMVFYGSIISISRYGARKMESGAISNASFEQSLETLTGAGLKGEAEKINGVSASILLGKMPRVGTGIVELKVDTEKLTEKPKEKLTVQPIVVESKMDTIMTNTNANVEKQLGNLLESKESTSGYCMEEDDDVDWIQEFKTVL